jgi:hypothetical protein
MENTTNTLKQPFLGEDPQEVLSKYRFDLAHTCEKIRATKQWAKDQAKERREQFKKEIISRMFKSFKDIQDGKDTVWTVDLNVSIPGCYMCDAYDILREEADRHEDDTHKIVVRRWSNYADLTIVKKVEEERRKCEDNAIGACCMTLLFVFFGLLFLFVDPPKTKQC